MDASSQPFPPQTGTAFVWGNLIRQYTQSLCHDVQSLVHPSKLDPIANIVSNKTKPVKGHDIRTRITMLRMLISKIRGWAELFVGLQNETIVDESAPSKEVEVTPRDEGQDTSLAVSDALASLFGGLKSAGALNLLTSKERRRAAKSSPLDIIRLVDESLQSDNWMQIQMERGEITTCQKKVKDKGKS